jgi:diadenosine tetraphosphate (Ap4A) HIT family hydrolase
MINHAVTKNHEPVDTVAGCLFCRFDDPSANRILKETDRFYARWDNFPVSDGHVEIVPKSHIVSFFDLTPDHMREAYELMCDVQKVLTDKYRPQGYTIGVNDGRAAGRTVDHLHIHVIPRYTGDVDDPRGGIRQILPGDDPSLWSGSA